MFVSKAPYLNTPEDLEVVIASIKNMQKAIAKFPEIVFEVPASNVTVEAYVKSVCVSRKRFPSIMRLTST
jgi:cellobiose dehydrogenase (acceptor)